MAYTETTTTSYGSRVKNSCAGIGIGIAMFLAGTALLWWNEGRSVKTADMLEEAEEVCVDMPKPDKIDRSLDGELVCASALATTEDSLSDEQFNIGAKAIGLKRSVKYYQWVEHEQTETEDKLGGKEVKTTTYTYSKEWVSSPVESAGFHDPAYQNKNMVLTTVEGYEKWAENVSFGAYKLNDGLIEMISSKELLAFALPTEVLKEMEKNTKAAYERFYGPIEKPEAPAAKPAATPAPAVAATPTADSTAAAQAADSTMTVSADTIPVYEESPYEFIHVAKGAIYYGRTPGSPEVGDVEVTIMEVVPAKVTIIAVANGDTFKPFKAKNKKTFQTLYMGKKSADEIFESENDANSMWTCKRYSYMLDLEGKIFSNDRLMIEDLFVRCSYLVDEKEKTEARYQDASDVKSCRFCSPSFLYDGKCQKGYYQDFDEHFAAIGLEDLTVKEKEALLTFNRDLWVRSWTYNNVQYHVYAYKNATVIASNQIINDERGVELYNKMVTFQGGKKLALNWKQFELDKKIKYIDMKVFPDDFCPAFLILPRNVKVNVMFVSEYNYNDLYQAIIDLLKNEGRLVFPTNLFYWDQMDECMDFLAILALMPDNGLNEDQRTALTDMYDRYKTLKPMLQAFGHVALRVIKYFKDFYYSFTTKINYDKLVTLQKRLADDLEEMRKLKNSSYYPDLIEWLQQMAEQIGVAQYCYKQATSAEFGGTIDKMISALNDLVDAKGNIIEQLKNICKCIYFLTPCGEAGSQPCIPYLFAIGGHLGALSYGMIDKEILEKNIEDERKKKAELEKLVNDEKLRLERAMTNLKTNEERIIRNTIENYCKAKGKEVSNDVKNRWADILIAKISSDEGLKKKIHAEIAKIAMSRGEVTTEYMDDFDQLELLFEGYEAEKDLERMKKRRRKLSAEIDKKRGELIEKEIDMDEPVEEIIKDPDVPPDFVSVFDDRMSRNLDTLSVPTTDSLGVLEDLMKYLNGTNKAFVVSYKNKNNAAKKGNKVEQWIRSAIYSSNAYGWKDKLVDKELDALALMKKYPLSHEILEAMIKTKVLPSLKEFLTKDRTRLTNYKLSDDAERMKKENKEGINSDMYIPKHFYTPTDYEAEE